MSAPFLILGLPRSRTAWLSVFLTYGNIVCHHELVGKHGIDALWSEMQYGDGEFRGNADTLAALYLDEIIQAMPDIRLVVVQRKPSEVVDSMRAKGFFASEQAIEKLSPYIVKAANLPGTLNVRFEALSEEATLRELQEHIAPGEPWHPWRFEALRDLNVQMSMNALNEIKRLFGQST